MNKFVLYDYFSSRCSEINNTLACGSCIIMATKKWNIMQCNFSSLCPYLYSLRRTIFNVFCCWRAEYLRITQRWSKQQTIVDLDMVSFSRTNETKAFSLLDYPTQSLTFLLSPNMARSESALKAQKSKQHEALAYGSVSMHNYGSICVIYKQSGWEKHNLLSGNILQPSSWDLQVFL